MSCCDKRSSGTVGSVGGWSLKEREKRKEKRHAAHGPELDVPAATGGGGRRFSPDGALIEELCAPHARSLKQILRSLRQSHLTRYMSLCGDVLLSKSILRFELLAGIRSVAFV